MSRGRLGALSLWARSRERKEVDFFGLERFESELSIDSAFSSSLAARRECRGGGGGGDIIDERCDAIRANLGLRLLSEDEEFEDFSVCADFRDCCDRMEGACVKERDGEAFRVGASSLDSVCHDRVRLIDLGEGGGHSAVVA